MKRKLFLGLVFTLAIGGGVVAQDDAARAVDGNHLAALLRAGRSVVSINQSLINDETKGDKGLTPDAFLAQVTEAYVAANGERPLTDDLTELQRRLIEAQLLAMSEVVDENQELINTPDMGFKGFIPAVFARLVNERFGEKVGDIAEVKATAPPELVRNRTARPDEWEAAVIKEKFRSPGWPKGAPWFETITSDTGSEFRMLIPEYYSDSCLSCHGEPVGEVDISGYPKEGGHEGDLGGAISITLKE